MSLLSRLLKIERKFAWSFLGVLLALLFGAITLYSNFTRQDRPQLRIDVLANATVLDVREEVGSFQVLYDGVDIGETNQTLRVITVEFKNDGTSSILKTYYDTSALPGLKITSGKIVEKEILGAASDYLSRSLRLSLQGGRQLRFSPVIIEPGEAFRVKMIVLDKIESNLQILPVGKVARVRAIELAEPYKSQPRLSFLTRAFAASPSVQLARAVGYPVAILLAMLVLVFGVIMPVNSISERLAMSKRRKVARAFRRQSGKDLSSEIDRIIEHYIKFDDWLIRSALSLLGAFDSEEGLVKRFAHFRKYKEAYRARYGRFYGPHPRPDHHVLYAEDLDVEAAYDQPRTYRPLEEWFAARTCFRLGVVELEEGDFVINTKVKDALERFASYLKEQ